MQYLPEAVRQHMFRVVRYHSIEVSLDGDGTKSSLTKRRRSVGELSPEALAYLTRVPANPGPDTAVLLRWQLAYGSALFDAGFFEVIRRAAVLSDRVTLVIECSGPISATPIGGAPPRPGASAPPVPADPIAMLDDLALRLERAWEAEWLDRPPASRPGFVLVRPDGAVALASTVPAPLRPVAAVLSQHSLFTAADVRAVFSSRLAEIPDASQLSHALGRLRAQGLAHFAAPSLAQRHRHSADRASEPFKVHVSPVVESERNAWASWSRAGVSSLGTVPFPSDGEQLSVDERVARRAARWASLAERLRARGLRTVLPAPASNEPLDVGGR